MSQLLFLNWVKLLSDIPLWEFQHYLSAWHFNSFKYSFKSTPTTSIALLSLLTLFPFSLYTWNRQLCHSRLPLHSNFTHYSNLIILLYVWSAFISFTDTLTDFILKLTVQLLLDFPFFHWTDITTTLTMYMSADTSTAFNALTSKDTTQLTSTAFTAYTSWYFLSVLTH